MSDPFEVPPRQRSLVPFLLLVLVLGAGLAYWRFAPPAKPVFEYETEQVARGSITATVAATGVLESTTTVTVGSQVSGPVKEILADFNSPVKVGQPLLILDPSEFQAKVGETTAGLLMADADLQNSQAKVLNSESAINKAQAQIEGFRSALGRQAAMVDSAKAAVDSSKSNVLSCRAQMDNALLDWHRFEQLYKRQLVAATDLGGKSTAYKVAEAAYQTALSGVDSAKAGYRQAVANYEGAKNDLQGAIVQLQASRSDKVAAVAQVASSRAKVGQAKASLEQAKVDLQRTVIRSPIRGVVIERKVENGQTVQASFTAPELYRIAEDLHEMQVHADISEADIGRVKEGQKVSFTVDSYPDQKFLGSVKQVRPAPATTTGTTPGTQNNVVVYGVLISAPNPNLLLRPGMTATVTIDAEELKDVLLVPDMALRFIPPNPPNPADEKKRKEKEDREKAEREKLLAKHGATPKKIAKQVASKPGTVWVETPDGPERRDLSLGVGDGKNSQVLDGNLKVGDKVYTKLLDDDKKHKGIRISF